MTAILFLQCFDHGQPASMPYDAVMALLSSHGKALPGRGDATFTFDDSTAISCTVVGDAAGGAACIGFEHPRYDAGLRALVWRCMQRFGCTVFDDALQLVNVPLSAQGLLPAALQQACVNGVRRIDNPLQLWPGEFEIATGPAERPALRYRLADGSGQHLQYFDSADAGARLNVDLWLHPAACNSATLRVVRNLELRIDDALAASQRANPAPGYRANYRYAHAETARLMLEAPVLADHALPSTVSSPPPGQAVRLPGFVMDREVYAGAAAQAAQLTEFVLEKYKLALDGSAPSIDRLALVLDKLHAFYRQQAGPERDALALRWASTAGSYLGMVMVRQIGGQWGYVPRGAQRLLAVRTHRGALFFPHLQVLDHIINRGGDNVAQCMRNLSEHGASPCPRKDDIACNVPLLCKLLREPAGPGALPLASSLAHERLDFSVASLHQLDAWLAQVAAQRDGIDAPSMARIALAAGVYLGEVVRNNAAAADTWRWRNYDDVAQDGPEFAAHQSRRPGARAVLDSDAQMLYPLDQVGLALRGEASTSLQRYAHDALQADAVA